MKCVRRDLNLNGWIIAFWFLCVAVQFCSCFKFYFPLFSGKKFYIREIKFRARMKLNHKIHIVSSNALKVYFLYMLPNRGEGNCLSYIERGPHPQTYCKYFVGRSSNEMGVCRVLVKDKWTITSYWYYKMSSLNTVKFRKKAPPCISPSNR